MKRLFAIICAIYPLFLHGQEEHLDRMPIGPSPLKGMEKVTSPNPGMGDTMYRDYIPYKYNQKIEVNVNLVFIQKDNGTGNFQEDNSEHQLFWETVSEAINERYSHLGSTTRDSCFAWIDPFIDDAHIHFNFNKIYLQDNELWDWSLYGSDPRDQSSALNQLRNEINQNPNIPLGICVFFTENSDAYDRYLNAIVEGTEVDILHESFAYSSFPDVSTIPRIHMPDTYTKYLWMRDIVPTIWETPVTWEDNVWYWEVNTITVLLSHELGHSLDLRHECNHYGEDYCRDALMSPSGSSGFSHNYMPPTEMGKMHKALSTTALQNVVPPNLPPLGLLELTQIDTWTPPFRSYTNMNIGINGRITANAGIQMPQKSHINVNGQLYIRNGDVECVMEDGTWNGIRVKEDGVLWLENTAISDYDIVMESGSTLILKGEVTISNNHKIVLGNGCYICIAPNTTINGDNRPFYVEGNVSCGIAPGTSLQQTTTCNTQTWNAFLRNLNYIPDVLYIQNQQITSDQTFVAKEIVVGSNVISSQTSGQVTIKNGAHVNFISVEGTRFDKGFRCENEASFIVTKIED